jgi:hypothetical protein
MRAGLLKLWGDGASGAHDSGAFVDQGPDGGEPDAAAGTSDDRRLGAEVEVHGTPFLGLEVSAEGTQRGCPRTPREMTNMTHPLLTALSDSFRTADAS